MKTRIFSLMLLVSLMLFATNCFAVWTTPPEAAEAFADLVVGIGAIVALAWTVANASTMASAGLKLFRKFIGKAI